MQSKNILNITEVYFKGADKKLHDLYIHFVTNNKIKEYLKTINVSVNFDIKDDYLICQL